VFLNVPEETWPAIAKDLRQVDALSSELRGKIGILHVGPGEIR